MSGSKVLLLVIIACALAACGTTRKGQKSSSATDKPDIERVLVYNPSTGKYEPVEDPASLVDTVEWTVVEDKPIGTPDEIRKGKKEVYKMAFLMPLDADAHTVFYDNIDPKTRRFLNYYAGVRMGLDALGRQGIHIDAHVFDTEESAQRSRELLRDLRDFDVVVGPYEREALSHAADWSSKRHITVVSPWTPSISLTEASPYFVQMLPGLEAHADAIMHYIGSTYTAPKIFLVTRNDERELARAELFEDTYRQAYPRAAPVERLIINDTSIDLASLDMAGVFAEDRTNIFVMPYFARADEEFINGVLRKLHADRGRHEVYVFGLPQWTNFNGLIPDYLESLRVHVSAVNYVDNTLPDVQTFNRAFFDRYAAIPEPAAMQGYTLTRYLGEALHAFGTGFLDQIGAQSSRSPFQPRPVFTEGARPEHNNPVMFYENKGIEILRFENQAFHLIQ